MATIPIISAAIPGFMLLVKKQDSFYHTKSEPFNMTHQFFLIHCVVITINLLTFFRSSSEHLCLWYSCVALSLSWSIYDPDKPSTCKSELHPLTCHE